MPATPTTPSEGADNSRLSRVPVAADVEPASRSSDAVSPGLRLRAQPLDRVRYFELGLDLLAEVGAKGVTIDALCTRLQVTKGSFYHHFAGVRDFMAQLLAYWEDRYGQRLAREALAARGPAEMIPLMKHGAAYDVHHEAESAIRALAQSDPCAAEAQRRVDQGREDLLTDAYVAVGMTPDTARALARIGVAILVGTQQRERPVDRDGLFSLLDEYQRWAEHSAGTDRLRGGTR